MARSIARAPALALVVLAASANAARLGVNPIQKVMSLLSQLEEKTIKDGHVEQKAFEDYVDWCKTGAKDKAFAITTAKSEIEDLDATIGQAASDIETLDSKVQDLAASISSNDADLKAATGIRDKEHSEFVETEKELVDAVDTLERAINVLERKMRGSAMLQEQVSRKDIKQMVHALSAVVDAAALSLHDKNTLLGLVQSNENAEDEEDDDSMGAPAAAAYESKSGSIVDVLEDLKQKAVSELEQARREESSARHSFEMTKQSLDDGIKVDQKSLTDSKTLKHSAEETKAQAEGELTVTKKELADSGDVLKNMKGQCMTAATDHEASTRDRQEELKAIAAAKKILAETSGGAQEQAYGFLQINDVSSGQSDLKTRADLAGFEVVNLVRKLAKKMKSAALAQLAGRISAAMKSGSSDDPFAKVKTLIGDMIVKLEQEGGDDAKHKEYCDKEMGETKQKMAELKYDLEKLTSKIDKARSTASKLKEEVAGLAGEIADISKSQAASDEYRREENAAYKQTKADLEQGLNGIRMALQVLRDYYANEADAAASASASASMMQQPEAPSSHSKASGAGNSIIGMLEVVESDLGKGLASTEMAEETAAVAYERMSMENRVSKSMKEKDVEYKTKAAVSNDKSVVELSSDRDSAQTELDAVLQYSANIRGMCEVKPESYEDRKARRETEVSGLREALSILEGEGVFLQKRTSGHLRGMHA